MGEYYNINIFNGTVLRDSIILTYIQSISFLTVFDYDVGHIYVQVESFHIIAFKRKREPHFKKYEGSKHSPRKFFCLTMQLNFEKFFPNFQQEFPSDALFFRFSKHNKTNCIFCSKLIRDFLCYYSSFNFC